MPTTIMAISGTRQFDVAGSTRCDGLIHEYRNAA
jgi:hypothetical protein